MYRAILEYVLGLRLRGDQLHVQPCIPDEWPGFEVELSLPEVDYVVRVERAKGAEPGLLLDGERAAGHVVPMLRDGRRHTVLLILG
jgi:cellobiose phosphorylase